MIVRLRILLAASNSPSGAIASFASCKARVPGRLCAVWNTSVRKASRESLHG